MGKCFEKDRENGVLEKVFLGSSFGFFKNELKTLEIGFYGKKCGGTQTDDRD